MLDLVIFIMRNRALLIGLPVAAGLISLVVALALPIWYAATTKILPPQQTQSNAVAILGQLGALAGVAGQVSGLKNPNDVFVAMLKSRSIADSLIKRFDLVRVYETEYLTETRLELGKRSIITSGRDGIVTVQYEDRDPQRAAAVANGYIDALRDLTVNLAVSEAAQRRLFFENQLRKAKDDLSTAEVALSAFAQEKQLVNPAGQVGLSVSVAASLQAQITAKQVQLASIRSFATEANPEMAKLRQEIDALNAELAKLEASPDKPRGRVLVPLGSASSVTLEYIRRFRDVKYYETLYEILAKQYEVARIDEARDATLIQVIDVAVPPELKSRPRRSVLVLITSLVALFCGTAIAYFKDYVLAQDENTGEKWRQIKRGFTLKSDA